MDTTASRDETIAWMREIARAHGADLELPAKIDIDVERGAILLQFGNQPGKTIVIGTPTGEPPFQFGWL